MGAGASEEESPADATGPGGDIQKSRGDAEHLHWILSDPVQLQELYEASWRSCCSSDGRTPGGGVATTAPKASIFDAALRIVEKVDGNMEPVSALVTSGIPPAQPIRPTTSKMVRRLRQVLEMFPDELTHAEGLHLFRTALLSMQTVLVVNSGGAAAMLGVAPPLPFSQDGDREANSPAAQGTPLSLRGATPAARDGEQQGPSTPSGAETAARRSLWKADDAEVFAAPKSTPLQRSRSPSPVPRRPRPVVVGPVTQTLLPLSGARSPLLPPEHSLAKSPSKSKLGGLLPSSRKLELENQKLRDSLAQLSMSCRERRRLVAALEQELQASRATARASLNGRFGLGGDAASATDPAWAEVRQLQSIVRNWDTKLAQREAEVAGRQQEIATILEKKGREEALATELHAELQELAVQLASSMSSCTGLEGEIRSEMERASALRDAFEGRRARYAAAEAAARSAEFGSMRAEKRRLEAEEMVYRERLAAERAENSRAQAAAAAAARVQALTMRLAEVRRQAALAELAEEPQHPAAPALPLGAALAARAAGSGSPSGRTVEAAALLAAGSELAAACRDRDAEVSISEAAARTVSELQAECSQFEAELETINLLGGGRRDTTAT